MRLILLIAAMIVTAATLSAQDATTVVTIVDHITAGTSNTVTQPEGLLKRLYPVISEPSDSDSDDDREETSRPVQGNRPVGYRVQVFSDNNIRTAKSEASSKERIISSRFPQYQTYVRYSAPYWRLKVGDFRTQQEANAAADELRRAFPAYAKEIRVVRDHITLPSD